MCIQVVANGLCGSNSKLNFQNIIIDISNQLNISSPEFSTGNCSVNFCWDISGGFDWSIISSSSTEIIFTVLLLFVLHLFFSLIPTSSK